MPSGAKKRRAAKRKKQEEAILHTKQADDVTGFDVKEAGNDEFTTVSVLKLTIPFEELAKGAVFHDEANSGGKANEVQVLPTNEVAPVGKDLEVINQPEVVYTGCKVATDDSAVERNQVSLLEAICNEENIMPKDEPVSTGKEDPFSKITHEDMASKDEPVVSENVSCIETVESRENLKKESIGVVSSDSKKTESTSKYTELLYDGITEALQGTVQQVSGPSSDSREADLAFEFLEQLTFGVPEEIIEFAPWLSGVSSNSNAVENTSLLDDLYVERLEELGIAQRASVVNDVISSTEAVKDNAPPVEKSGCSSAEPACAGSPSTENHVYVACPLHCNPACSFPRLPGAQPDVEITARKEDLGQMTSVKDLESVLRSLEAALLIALDKLKAVSY